VRSLFVAPHPDDELLGCGGTILRKSSQGDIVGWLLITSITSEAGWSPQKIFIRDQEIERVREGLSISPNNIFSLGFPAAQLDQIPSSQLIAKISTVFKQFQPQEVFLPHPGDIHTDHRITFEAVSACTKWFRYPSVQRIMTYETLSETNFEQYLTSSPFTPNLFIDVSNHLTQKLKLLEIYKSELGMHPFPRSLDAVRALALLRGSQRGVAAAEAFQIIKAFE